MYPSPCPSKVLEGDRLGGRPGRRTALGMATIVAVAVAGFAISASAASPPTCAGPNATITGTTASEVIRGTSENDVIVGGGGEDSIRGRGGNDEICANEGSDASRAAPAMTRWTASAAPTS